MTTHTTEHEKNVSLLDRINHEVKNKTCGMNDWGAQHAKAWAAPQTGMESAMKGLLVSLASYADHYHAEGYELISQDGYAGPAWLDMVKTARHLLSMDRGRLDGGTLDTAILAMVKNEGFDIEKEGF